jgi:2-oxoglutarate dehydrogenase E2 component (dihydrolipoamide succinyltransferase)
MLTTFNEGQYDAINTLRNRFKAISSQTRRCLVLRYMSFYKSSDRALQMYPDVNSMMDGDYKIAFDFM